MALLYSIQNLWYIESYSVIGILKAIAIGLLTGITAGFLFALILGLFKISDQRKPV